MPPCDARQRGSDGGLVISQQRALQPRERTAVVTGGHIDLPEPDADERAAAGGGGGKGVDDPWRERVWKCALQPQFDQPAMSLHPSAVDAHRDCIEPTLAESVATEVKSSQWHPLPQMGALHEST